MSTDAMQAAPVPLRQESRGPRAHTHARAEVLRMLKDDHRTVKIAFREFERLDIQAEAEICESIVRQTCRELEVHTRLEEELFYPVIREALAHAELMDDAEVEHQTMRMLLDQVRKLRSGDARQAASFRVLGEYVRHHIKEEEGEMFRQIAHARLDWVRLHDDMVVRRHQLLAEVDEPLHLTTLEPGKAIGVRPRFEAPAVPVGRHP